jgi:hypothetical protein
MFLTFVLQQEGQLCVMSLVLAVMSLSTRCHDRDDVTLQVDVMRMWELI